jgi:DNA-binding response OmpR family regulator
MAQLLVVDNDARVAELVAWFLEKGGHAPCVVTSYAAARELLRERDFALMLADLELGVEDGRVELPRLEAEGLLPRTIVVSGYLDAEIAEGLERIEGVVATVSKPFEPAELLALVDSLVGDAESGGALGGEELVVGESVGDELVGEERCEEELEEIVIEAAPAVERIVELGPAILGSGAGEDPVLEVVDEGAEKEWVEIVREDSVDFRDWGGAG